MSKWRGGVIRSTQITPGGSDETAAASGVWRASDAAYWAKQGSWPSTMTPDTYFPNTTLLLNGDSVNRGQNNIFVDGSSVGSPITRYGNATQGSFTPFGTNWSAYFDGSGDYLTTPSNTAFLLPGDFTVEAWIYIAGNALSTDGSGRRAMSVFNISQSGNFNFQFGILGDGTTTGTSMELYSNATGGVTVSGSISQQTWHHVAVARSGSSVYFWLDGAQFGTTQTLSGSLGSSSASANIGRTNASGYSQDMYGYISNLRVVKGTALYTSSFTVPISPLTAISGTSLLTCQSNRFVDNSSNAFTITRNGDTKITKFSPFSTVGRANSPTGYYNQNDVTNWSNYFSSGNYLTLANSTALTLSGGTYTIEMWINPSGDYGNYNTLIGKRVASSSSTAWEVYLRTSTGVLSFYNGTNYESSVTPTAGMWSHVAAVYDGTYMNLYLNGTRVLQSAITNSDVSASTYIGTYPSYDERFIGYISNLRITKGAALYSGTSFTPPTGPLTTSVSSGTVSLLTCQSGAYVDNSTNSAALTVTGQPLVCGFSPFNTVGYNSVYFDGSSDWLATPSDAAFGFGTGDYTIECWMYPTSTKADMRLWNFSGDSDNIDISGSGGGTGAISYYNGSTSTYSSSGVVNFNAWNHVACVRSSGTTRVYLNGVLRVTQTTTPNTSARILYIAGQPNSWFEGYISNFRVVKGTAVYTGAFTPPTAPLTAVTNTSLLTCQNSSFKDNSTNAFTLTRNGDAKVQTFNPFVSSTALTNCGSMYFDGTGDYLTVANSPINNLGTSDFTIELWFKSDTGSMNTHACLVASYSSAVSGSWAFKAQSGTSGYIQFASYGPSWNDWVTTTNIASDMAWHHCAVTRSGNTLRIFVDGTQRGSWDISAASSFTGGGHPLSVGFMTQDSTSYLNGNISNLRIIKGTALYTSAFTPPTAPVTPTAATTFYVNGMNGAIADQTTLNTLETVGDTKISTSIKKYGTGSIYMDGTSDWLYMKGNENFHFASSNFTMEGWFYFTNSTANALQTIFSNYTTWNASGQGTIFWGKHTSSSGYMSVWFSNYNSGAPMLSESSMPPSNTWVHYALVRNGNTFTLYRDGVSTASASFSGAATTIAPPGIYIGTAGDATQYAFPGYIDDFRITKGVARYTSAFTPPTSAHATR